MIKMKATSITLDKIAQTHIAELKCFLEEKNTSSIIRYALWIATKYINGELD